MIGISFENDQSRPVRPGKNRVRGRITLLAREPQKPDRKMGYLQKNFAKQRDASTCDNLISSSRRRYDVFLSFRGKDTRKNFTDHLYTALVDSGLRTFRDDDELERGEDITTNLPRGIQDSHCSIIVFSKDYASSQWCLDELVLILRYKRRSGHFVLPVFYDVDPSEVRNQSGSFAKPFEELERLVKPMSRTFDMAFGDFWWREVQGWRTALREVADLAGMNLRNQADGHESMFIKKIVTVIEEKLRRTSLSVAPYLIGIQSQVNAIDTWLQDESSDFSMFVIYGMAGVGKTTLAKYVYNSNFKRFDGSSFLENISEVSKQATDLVQLQRQLISNISRKGEVNIHNVSEGTNKIKDVVRSKRVLVVLDDVDQLDQLDAILGMRNWFHLGSKIIITTRQRLMLKAHEVHKLYEVKRLYDNEALRLFSWHAFGQDQPFEDYLYLSKGIADHCGGLPLALQILGSSLSGKPMDVWESAWKKMKNIPNTGILKKLKLSYDSLQDDHDKYLFLDITCFFIGEDKDFIVGILDECDFYTKIGIQNLIDRCLITIDLNNKVVMHRLLRDMGREIIRQESPKEPSKRSRVWNPKDSFNVLTQNMGGETIEGMVVNMHGEDTSIENSTEVAVLETNALAKMHKMRLLILNHVQLSGYYTSFPKRLRWLSWHGFPLDSIPGDLHLENLIVLDIRYSGLKRAWKVSKHLPSLKILNLSHSPSLTETPNFTFLPKLERLILQDCSSLVDVHESIGNLDRLVYLNMNDCKSIQKLPKNFCKLKFLETLLITGCSSLHDFPIEDLWMMKSLKIFYADGTPVNQSLNSIPGKNKLSLSFPRYLVSISLVNCNLQFEDDFPSSLANLSGLRDLNLNENPIFLLPDCIRSLSGLNRLDFTNCKRLESLVGLPKVDTLVVSFCSALRVVTFISAYCRSSNLERDSNSSLVEFEYWFKLEPIAEVDPELINILGLNLKSLHGIFIDIHSVTWLGIKRLPIQGLHEHGVFSIFFPAPGNEVPGVFSYRSTKESSMSFTVPMLSDVRIQGLNVYCVYANYDTVYNELTITHDHDVLPKDMMIQVNNRSRGLKWIYAPLFLRLSGWRRRDDMVEPLEVRKSTGKW